MISDEAEGREWIIGIVVTVLIIGGLYWIRNQPIEEEAAGPMPVGPASAQYQSDPHREQGALAHDERVITTRRSSPSTIGRVFECEQDGQRVLSDQRCGADAAVREIAAPNRMQAQDTSVLYEPLPRSIQVQKRRAARQRTGSNAAICTQIDEDKDRINARMRQPYTSWEGERLRARLRELSERRWKARCGK